MNSVLITVVHGESIQEYSSAEEARIHLSRFPAEIRLAIASHSQYPVRLGSVAASGSSSHLALPNGSFRLGERDVLRYVATRKSERQ